MKELSQTLLNDVNFFSQENEHVGSWLSYDWKSNDLQCHEYWAIGTILQSLFKACCKFMKICSFVWILQASISPTKQVEWTFALFQTFDMLIIDSYDCWIVYIHNDSDCYHSCTQIICWWTKSQCPVLAKCREEKTLEMKTCIVATIVLLVCCLFELAMKLVLLVCYLFEPTMKRSSILPPVIKQSLKSQTVNTRRIWSPKLSMPC